MEKGAQIKGGGYGDPVTKIDFHEQYISRLELLKWARLQIVILVKEW